MHAAKRGANESLEEFEPSAIVRKDAPKFMETYARFLVKIPMSRGKVAKREARSPSEKLIPERSKLSIRFVAES